MARVYGYVAVARVYVVVCMAVWLSVCRTLCYGTDGWLQWGIGVVRVCMARIVCVAVRWDLLFMGSLY